ncbi:MAG: hypothetical protein D6773_11350 [Alphaproteobacteria bacterium]|nr:MAG: hypothetical protein D6773_11350 [Alphaproteobacteria bacterium]
MSEGFDKWGYAPNGDARIFRVGPDGKLPKGWFESPAEAKADNRREEKRVRVRMRGKRGSNGHDA